MRRRIEFLQDEIARMQYELAELLNQETEEEDDDDAST